MREELKLRALNIIDTAKKEVRALTEDEDNELREIREQLESTECTVEETEEVSEEIQEKTEIAPDFLSESEGANEVQVTEAAVEPENIAPDFLSESEGANGESEGANGESEGANDVHEVPVTEDRQLTNPNLEKKMKKEFRLIKAIRDIANNRSMDEVSAAVVAAGAEEMRKSGLSFGGQIQLPTESRSIHVTLADGVHDDLVETDFTNILAPLRAKNVLVSAGAKYLDNLVGDVQVPMMTASNVGWAGEIDDAAEGAGTFSHVLLQPKRLTAYIDVSKQFLAQDSLAAEELLRSDLVKAINSKLEETILGNGAGDANTPEGIFHVVTATTVSNFADVCDKEADVEDANVLGNCVYVMSNKAKAAFRCMAKSTKSTQLVMEGGQIDGTTCLNTSNVAGTNYVYGDFSNLAIGQWGAIDLTVDPFTLARSGQIRLVINAFFDAKVLRAGAFATGTVSNS